MGINKIIYNNNTLIDLTDTTATASDVVEGTYFYTNAGVKTEGTIVDGDNLEYGTAGLVGTTWLFNSTLDLSEAGTYDLYYIDFTSNSTDYTTLQLTNMTGVTAVYYIVSNTITYAYEAGFIGNGWTDQAYRTITITGGTDATNQDLIDWITANATQQ